MLYRVSNSKNIEPGIFTNIMVIVMVMVMVMVMVTVTALMLPSRLCFSLFSTTNEARQGEPSSGCTWMMMITTMMMMTMTTAMIMMLDAMFGWGDGACFVNYDDDDDDEVCLILTLLLLLLLLLLFPYTKSQRTSSSAKCTMVS